MLGRSLEFDIAVDLKGFTQDARAGIFAARAAPGQVNYLGYPGTVFAERTNRDAHLSRHQFADPLRYGAHTAASDTLRTGLPAVA